MTDIQTSYPVSAVMCVAETPKEQTRAVKIEPGLQGSKLDFDVLPPSEEAVYVQETAKQVTLLYLYVLM